MWSASLRQRGLRVLGSGPDGAVAAVDRDRLRAPAGQSQETAVDHPPLDGQVVHLRLAAAGDP